MKASEILNVARNAFRNARDNDYTFEGWTGEMLADDMIAFDDDVERVIGDNWANRQFLIECCDVMLEANRIGTRQGEGR